MFLPAGIMSDMSTAHQRCPFGVSTPRAASARRNWLAAYELAIANYDGDPSELVTWQEFAKSIGDRRRNPGEHYGRAIKTRPPRPAITVYRTNLYRRADLAAWTTELVNGRASRRAIAEERRKDRARRSDRHKKRLTPIRSRSGYRGVAKQTAHDSWRAFIGDEHIGSFTSPVDAALAVDRVRMERGLPPVNFPHRAEEAMALDMPQKRPRRIQQQIVETIASPPHERFTTP